MLRLRQGICASLLLLSMGSASAAPGLQQLEIANPARNAAAHAMVWYPTAASGSEKVVGANAVFVGTAAQENAPVTEGRHPLVLIAHGGFRSAPHAANWLAAALASRGWIAAIVTPPRLPRGLPDATVFEELVLRPADLSATIDALQTSPFGDHINADKIAAVGFFLGGYSVLALTGATPEPEKFAGSCTPDRLAIDCPWFARARLDLSQVDSHFLNADVFDARVRAVFAIDPEWTHLFGKPGLQKMRVPTHLMNLGAAANAASPLSAQRLSAELAHAEYSTLADANAYSAFAQCQARGALILQADDGDPALCTSGSPGDTIAADRSAIHQQLITTIDQWLSKHLAISR